jgi:integrase
MADPTNLTVDAYLVGWLENTVRVKSSPTTYERWEQLSRLHVRPHIGHLKLSKVRPMHIHGLMGTLEKNGESAWTRKMVGSILHNAFRQARRFRLIVQNPCEDVPRVKPGEREMANLTAGQAKTFRQAAGKKRLAALLTLAVGSGMRQGELLGLEWPDIDFDRGTVTVRRSLAQLKGRFALKEPKSKQSRRTIKLPPVALTALAEHRRAMLKEGQDVKAGTVFVTRRRC